MWQKYKLAKINTMKKIAMVMTATGRVTAKRGKLEFGIVILLGSEIVKQQVCHNGTE